MVLLADTFRILSLSISLYLFVMMRMQTLKVSTEGSTIQTRTRHVLEYFYPEDDIKSFLDTTDEPWLL